MAEIFKNAISSRVSEIGKDLWKAATVPYNTAIILATIVVMVEGQAWKLEIV